MAEDKYKEFLGFDWSDERWQKHFNGLYPTPSAKNVIRFKKKWYKKEIDPEFDVDYQPEIPAAPAPSSDDATSGGSRSSTAPPQSTGSYQAAYDDGKRWASMGSKSTTCFLAYAVSLSLAVGAIAGVFPPYQALVVLVSTFMLEILAKYGLKFNSTYVQSVLLDDVGVMPIMAMTLLTPGLVHWIRVFALVPSSLTAALSFAQICKMHKRIPPFVRDFFEPLAEIAARYKVMQFRSDAEVLLGFVLIIGVFTAQAAPIAGLLFWNFMMMRYMMSHWTQATFRKIDGVLDPTIGRIPGLKQLYEAIKRGLWSFVDPEAKKQGRLCSIL